MGLSHKLAIRRNTYISNNNPTANKYHTHRIKNNRESIDQEQKVNPSIPHINECLSILHRIHSKIDNRIGMSYDCTLHFFKSHSCTCCIVCSSTFIRKILIEKDHIILHDFWKSIFYSKRFCIFHSEGFSMDHSHLKHHYIINLDKFFCCQILILHYTVKFFWTVILYR